MWNGDPMGPLGSVSGVLPASTLYSECGEWIEQVSSESSWFNGVIAVTQRSITSRWVHIILDIIPFDLRV